MLSTPEPGTVRRSPEDATIPAMSEYVIGGNSNGAIRRSSST
jgi:hypothetical protein